MALPTATDILEMSSMCGHSLTLVVADVSQHISENLGKEIIVGAGQDIPSWLAELSPPWLTSAADALLTATQALLTALPEAYRVDGWSPEEVILIPLYLVILKPALESSAWLWRGLALGDWILDGTEFDDSLFGYLYDPLRLLAVPVTIDFLLDNAINFAAALHTVMPSLSSDPRDDTAPS